MTVNAINGSALTGLSAVDGVTLSTVSAIDGQSLAVTTPSGIANIWEWWEPSRDTYNDGDPMGLLTGQFAAKNFTSSGSNRPTYNAAFLNGLGVADTTSNKWWDGPDASALTAGHLWIVLRPASDPGTLNHNTPWRIGTVSAASTYDWWPFSDGKVYMGAGSTTRRTCANPTALLNTAWHVCEVVTTSSEYTVLLDGSESLFTSATNTVGFLSTILLGHAVISTTGDFSGKIAGFYIFSAKLTGADRTAMVNYINSRFGLSIV